MRIALTLDRDADLSETNDYVRSLVRAGIPREAIAVVTPDSPPPDDFDALVLGGGEDVDPARYGRDRLDNGTVEVDPGRDALDFELLARAERAGAPVLGICRGLQVVNVARGGTLVQDIPSERPSPVTHQREHDKTRLDHEVRADGGTLLSSIGGPEFLVNSRHHQAIEALGSGLRVSGRSPDGLVEAVEGDSSHGSWLVAVQWHPENLQDPVSLALFREFAAAAAKGSTVRSCVSGAKKAPPAE